VIFLIVMTTTLSRRKTPRPLASMLIRLRTSLIMTIRASKRLNPSERNMRLLAKVFSNISEKNRVKKTLSTCYMM
jgi:hypothetical protein